MESLDDDRISITHDSTKLQRPFGVALLSTLTGCLGLVLLAAFVILLMNWQENNEFALKQRMAPSVFWVSVFSGVVLAFVASVGMWRGKKWGWWIGCSGMVMFLIQNIVSVTAVNLSEGAPSVSTFVSLDSIKYIVRGSFFAFVLAYWLRTNVRKYFQVEKTSRIKAVILAAVCGIGITTVVIVILQFIFLFRNG